MSRIKSDNDEDTIGYIYSLKNVTTKDTSLQWIGNCAQSKEISCRYIEVSDGKSYHDGTISDQYSIDEFNENFEQIQKDLDEFISLQMNFKYYKKNFNLVINLETYQIYMWCSCENEKYLPELEILFGLLD